MSSFVPSLCQLWIRFSNLNKTAAKNDRLLEKYLDLEKSALSERSVSRVVSKVLKQNGKLDVGDKDRSARSEVYEIRNRKDWLNK